MEKIFLKNILSQELPTLVSLDELYPVGDAEIGEGNVVKVKTSGGFRTKIFETNEEAIAAFSFQSKLPLNFRVGYTTSSGEVKLDGVESTVSVTQPDGTEKIRKSFDCANLIVYRDAKDFFVQIDCEGENEIKMTSGIVHGNSELGQLSIYSGDLENIIKNIDRRLLSIEYRMANNTENMAVSPSGKRFIINVDDDGNVFSAPVIPNKVLFIGNSILLGMGGYYGMCATSPKKDYCYLVTEALKAKNPNVEISKLHGAGFEQLEDEALFEDMWSKNENSYTHKPMCESFTPDLDLIIIQISENVNTGTRLGVFEANIEKFITRIKACSPKARIVWVHSWWRNAKRVDVIETACRKYRIGCISISELYSRESIAHVGQEFERADGTKGIAPERWLSHPGDVGMKAIADRIIDFLRL